MVPSKMSDPAWPKKEVKTALEEIIMKGGFYVEDAIALKSKINL